MRVKNWHAVLIGILIGLVAMHLYRTRVSSKQQVS